MNERTWSCGCVRTVSVVLLALLVVGGGRAIAQQGLGDIVEQEGFAWMAGRWTMTTDEGAEFVVSYRWVLDKRAVVTDLTMGQYASHGMIYYSPTEDKVMAVSVDNRGGITRGTWDISGEKALSKGEYIGPDGRKQSGVVKYSKVDPDTMKVEGFSVEAGEVAAEPSFTVQLKRQKQEPATNKATEK